MAVITVSTLNDRTAGSELGFHGSLGITLSPLGMGMSSPPERWFPSTTELPPSSPDTLRCFQKQGAHDVYYNNGKWSLFSGEEA